MVKVSFVLSVSATAQIQLRQTISALFGSGGGARLVRMGVITSEYRSSDSERSRAGGAVRQTSPQPAAVGAPPYRPWRPMHGL